LRHGDRRRCYGRSRIAPQKLTFQAHPDACQQQKSNEMQGCIDIVSPERSPKQGKLTGAKPPLWPKHVWSIRAKLQIAQ
jgi:hypothetical protein